MMRISEFDMRDSLIDRIYEYARADAGILFLSNDYGAPSLDRFRAEIPDQFINAAISEQNMVAVAAGLALAGKKVYVYSIASFLTLRCLEQIKIDVCAMNLPVTFIGVGTAYAYSFDGPTHHATEDIPIMRSLANMIILSPSDSNSAVKCADYSLRQVGPTYIRLDRGKLPLVFDPEQDDLDSGCRLLRTGDELCIVSTGSMIHRALEVSERLSELGFRAAVIDLFRLKPVDDVAFLDLLGTSKRVVTLEEQTLHGGLGGIIAEILADAGRLMLLKRIAVEDCDLYAYGERGNLHRVRSLDLDGVVATILAWLQ